MTPVSEAEYEGLLKKELLLRFRIVSSSGALIYLVFGGLDHAVYPEYFNFFLEIRAFISLFLLGLFGISFIPSVQRNVRAWIDLMIIVAGSGLIYMVYKADGALSGYYQGVSIVLLANFAANSFSAWHNLFAGGTLLLLYQVALILHPMENTLDRVFAANFFMGGTLFFVVLLTHLFQRQHRASFLKTKELETAYQKLRESEAVKSQFFSNVSHELKTPLSLILAPVESLLSGSESTISPQLLKVIHNNTLRLLQMITGLLDFNKFEAGKMKPEREPLNLDTLVRSIVIDFEPFLRKKQLSGEVKSNLAQPVREMDRYMLDRILTNLLSNAIKFTPEKGHIGICLSSKEFDRISLTVEDTGIGIKAEDIPKLFQRFRQIDGASVRRFEGVGLGLALVKELCEGLGGKVSVQSEPNKGSEFQVDLFAPVSSAPALELVPIQHVIPFVEDTQTIASSPHDSDICVLIAEDNVELANYLGRVLGGLFHIEIAKDGEEAWEKCCRIKPDIVLADVMMPKMDGFDLCRQIKNSKELSTTPVVLLTALAHREALLKGWTAGADDYLFKPFHPTELTARLRSIVSALRTRRMHEKKLQAQSASLARRETELEQLNLFQFIASHQFQEPLHQILSRVTDLNPNVEFKEELGEIAEATRRLQLLIEGARDFTSVGTSSVVERVDLNNTIKIVQTKFQTALKNVELEVEILPEVQASQRDMDLLFSHLISNALKYQKAEGKLRVNIRAIVDAASQMNEIYVEDNGIGFKPTYLTKVFEPFRRLHAPTEYGGGAGIGLAICRKIVLKYLGTIVGTSEEGVGSRFVVRLPLLVAMENMDGSSSEKNRRHR